MNIRQIIKKYMAPFLKEYGFAEFRDDKGGYYIFKHTENPELRIYFNIRKTRLCEEVRQGVSLEMRRDNNPNILYPYRLSLFFDEPEEMETAYRDEYWYFDTEEELIGVLEEQANLLKTKAFDWMFHRVDFDIDAILDEKALEHKNAYDSADDFGKQLLLNKCIEKSNEWIRRRVKPVNWK